jgi:uncharacterized membrane protein
MVRKLGKYTLFLLMLAPIIAWLASRGADLLVISRWNTEDSAVVRLEEVLERSSDFDLQDASGWDTERVAMRITFRNGPLAGETKELEILQLADSRLELVPGREYLFLVDTFDDGSQQFSISDRYRIPAVAGFITFACVAFSILTGFAGVKALLGLFFSLFLLLGWFVPRLAEGHTPVPFAILAVAGVSILTIMFVVPSRSLWPIPFLGAVGGTVAASITGWLMVALWQLTGLENDSAVLLFSVAPHLELRGLLLAAVMVGAIGAVLDVAVSVTSSMAELYSYDPSIPIRRLWQAGINVGSDVLGSMINTLILAYLGSSLPFVVLIAMEGPDFTALVNDPHIAQELLRSVAGTVGLLLTIPVTASVGSWWIWRSRPGREKRRDEGATDRVPVE